MRLLGALVVVLVGASAAMAAGPSGGTGLGGGTTTTTHRPAPKHHRSPAPAHSAVVPFDGRAMWIWEMALLDGGRLGPIVAAAHQYGVRTLVIKSSDGSGMWTQFTPALVHTLHASGLRVCAWQYV